jgi:uncharacterized UBP type Zn finger protein
MRGTATQNAQISSIIRQRWENDQLNTKQCTHLSEIQEVIPSAEGCEECLKIGDTWVHLRLCLICGKVGCCDNSKNKHATRHYHETSHPLIVSFEPEEEWVWCYPDEAFIVPKKK